MDTAKDIAGPNYYNGFNGSNNVNDAPDIFIREYMDLDEFFAARTAVTRDVQTRSCEVIDESFFLNTDCDGDSCLYGSDECQMQEVPQMSAAEWACYERAEGGRKDDRIANVDDITNGCTTRNTQQHQSSRKSPRPSANSCGKVDNTYWDRRVKNNIAAKRSRDAKRTKEVKVVERWKFLEEENKRLKRQIANMKERTSGLEKKLLA